MKIMYKQKSKHQLMLLTLILFSSHLLAQPFEIGHTTMAFFDSTRNRNVDTEVYYPANMGGDDVEVATGNFPVLVFGHGFLMTWDSYQNIWSGLVPEGYVVCFPTTEMTFNTSHENFGLDLSFIADQMQSENGEDASIFFNALLPKTGLMGHSMGGGASFLAAENNSTIATLVNFAAAETTPSAIAAALNIQVPSLLFSGDDDCVTPMATNQNLMYDNLASSCKTQIKIIDGGHCYFANDNFNCGLGESFCNPTLNITREEQQSITMDFLTLWLNYTLKDNQDALDDFNESLQNSTTINFSQSCNNTTTAQQIEIAHTMDVFPNPAVDLISFELPKGSTQGVLHIYNVTGEVIYQDFITQTKSSVNVSMFPIGTYFVELTNDSFRSTARFVKVVK